MLGLILKNKQSLIPRFIHGLKSVVLSLGNKFILFIGVFLLLLLMLLLLPKESQPLPSPSPVVVESSIPPNPTGNPYSQEYLEAAAETVKKEQSLQEKDQKVGKFIDFLPFKGNTIEVIYQIRDNSITLYLQTGNEALGNHEFDTLLEQFGIESRSWLQRFKIEVR